MRKIIALGIVSLILAGCGEDKPVLDEAAVARGKKQAENCTPCHSLRDRAANVGPPLFDVIGRKAGSYEGYDFSAGMKASGITWTPDQLARFLQDPTGVVPGTKMALGPLTPAEASDIVVYLQHLSR